MGADSAARPARLALTRRGSSPAACTWRYRQGSLDNRVLPTNQLNLTDSACEAIVAHGASEAQNDLRFAEPPWPRASPFRRISLGSWRPS